MAKSGKISNLVRARRALRASWPTPLFDRSLAVLGVIIAVGTAIFASRSLEELLNVLLITLLLSNLVMAALVFILAKQNSSLASSNNITESDAVKIAEEFRNLSSKQCDYESAVATYLTRLIARHDAGDDWTKLKESLDDYIECLCDTAVHVITRKKGKNPDNCSANIKTFASAPDKASELVYVVFKRSRNSDLERDSADNETRKKEFRVNANRIYDSMMESKSHVCISDISDYLEETDQLNLDRIQVGLPTYKEPSRKNTLRFYNGCMVVPIFGRDVTLRTLASEDMPGMVVQYETASLLGTFCIDSKNINFFDESYDLHVMNQLASQAFSVLRTYYVVSALKNSFEKSAANVIQNASGKEAAMPTLYSTAG